jgi:GNAT superfamily N-acetyltransferase
MENEILPGYTLHPVTEEEFMTLYKERESLYFAGFEQTDLIGDVSDHDREQFALRHRAFTGGERFQWFIQHKGDIIGWTLAQQDDPITLLMRNTAVDPAHRRGGVYTALLAFVVAFAREHGYQRITSTHSATNNAILIPKLKADFVISGMHVDERFGVMVHLTHFLYPHRRSVVERRVRGF